MTSLASHLGGIRGRRVSVIWISEGYGFNIGNPGTAAAFENQGRIGIGFSAVPPDVTGVALAMRKMLEAFRRANVTLYGVDPRRLWFGMAPDGTCQVSRRSVESLINFSAQTGGFAAVDTNQFHDAFERILEESSQYYVLGYQPDRPGRDGDFRSIRVSVRGRRDLQVSARPGYVVSSAAPPVVGPPGVTPALAVPMVANVPAAGLPLRVQAIPRRGTKGAARVQIVVEVPGKDLRFTEVKGRLTERLTFALRVVDDRARAVDLTETLDLNLSSEEAAQVTRTGVRWLPVVTLAPGHYSLRIGGEAAGTKLTGSIFADIDVPKFEDDDNCPPLLDLCGLQFGGLAVTSSAAASMRSAGSLADSLGLPGPPTTARTFVRGDVITVSADLATPDSFKQGTLHLTVRSQTATADSAPPLLERTVTLADREAAHQVRAWPVDTSVLGVEEFVLRLTVRDARGRSAETGVLFEVVDK